MSAITGGSGASSAIKAIDKDAVHRICSGQVIVDLPVAVKELVENALVRGGLGVWFVVVVVVCHCVCVCVCVCLSLCCVCVYM